MTSATHSPEALITARLMELVDRRTPWHRGLWHLGSLLILQEVLEYANGVRVGAMRPEGLTYVTESGSRVVQRDIGLGPQDVRDEIVEILSRGAAKANSPNRGVLDPSVAASLEQLVRRCENGYIRSWKGAFERGEVGPTEIEFLARSIIAHLLDAGFSRDHLHGWLLAGRDAGASLSVLLEQADEMCRRDDTAHEVMVPFQKLPEELSEAAGDRFLSWEEMLAKLEGLGATGPPGRKGAGALIFTIEAREPKAAVEKVEVELRRIAARVAIGLSVKRAIPSGHVSVLTSARVKWMRIPPASANILVSSIPRHRLLLPAARTPATTPLDDAFELLAAVETSTSWASVAATWAAVEGLLARATESGADAADRMAYVVAGGFVRAELTQLIDVLACRGDALSEELGASSPLSQLRKLDRLARAIGDGHVDFPDSPADAAAVARVESIFSDPAGVMSRVVSYYKDAFRRLYNQRNLLLHGGRFDSIALPATMRTVPPLVAAGIDRLVHAAMQRPPTASFGLAARASNEISLLGKPGSRPVHRLLD